MTTGPGPQYDLDDVQIRSALLRAVGGVSGSGPKAVVQELGMLHGANRVDLVVIGRDLHGYEIKSDKDSLRRFKSQVATYSQVMDRVTVVAGWRWIVPAMKAMPSWWGAMLAERTRKGTVRVVKLREPEKNPEPDLLAVAQLLWRDEALRILEDCGRDRGVRSKPRETIYRRLVEVFPDSASLSGTVREVLIRRAGRRAVSR